MALLQFFSTFMPRFIRKSVLKGLICLDFEDSKPKSLLIFQKCHYNSDIWPRLELNRFQKLLSASVKNLIEAKNHFLPRVELNHCQKLFSASVKNWTEAKRFVRVQKSRIIFFLLLPCVHVYSLNHPPPLLLLRSDHSWLLDVWLIRVLA